jgi:hypothetical protein
MTANAPTVPDAGQRRRGVRRTAWLLGCVAAAFYLGFMIMMIYRGSR